MELSYFVFRSNEQSYEINEDYFYGEEEPTFERRAIGRGEINENDFNGVMYNEMLIYRQTHLCQ